MLCKVRTLPVPSGEIVKKKKEKAEFSAVMDVEGKIQRSRELHGCFRRRGRSDSNRVETKLFCNVCNI